MEEITGEADYVNAPEGPADKKAPRPEDTKKGSAPEGTVDTKASPPGLRFVLPIAVCWIILLAIMGLRIYYNAKQTAEIKTLTSQKDGLTKQIQEMERNWNELNVSRAQWSINEYCKEGEVKWFLMRAEHNGSEAVNASEGPEDTMLMRPVAQCRQCRPCEKNWIPYGPSCYSVKHPDATELLTWEEAREYCRALNADLAAAHSLIEKIMINIYRPVSSATNGYWIGLRVEDGKWKWADGSDLTDSSWIGKPTEGHCALSVRNSPPWSSVSCEEKQQWICQKKALSV
ncbi:C-type lectin domain family 12 member B-like isoform X2 [Gymnodraco acuticeps]|uniref:C-type lectin domain family 12 member B-like isoform X2 n=1 Tax=Gymnodraco acuticeps TaxID=8218 RepID=A0A6P8VRJ4_GYMAC|nr:C-type lectin domain family 12 member B-like isoform X2 [Gymnodraco acuticeps]